MGIQLTEEASLRIKYYQDYLTDEFLNNLKHELTDFAGVAELKHRGESAGLETKEAMQFVVDLYKAMREELNEVLTQRAVDRKFIDERMKSLYQFNLEYENDFETSAYETVLGLEDENGKIVIGPLTDKFHTKNGEPIAPIPEYLKGNHVTLFGPPEGAKLSINAMNAFHRKLKEEPAVVEEILKDSAEVPKWGADDEDSKTPLRADLITAGDNLKHCFDGDLEFKDPKNGKHYKLAQDKRSFPIKRFPGLALPCSFLFLDEEPIPLHIYDFALHLYSHYHNPQALVFYVPKLENEYEARYIKNMFETAEKLIQKKDSTFKLGTVRCIIVLENPRAVFRVNEMMDELYPYFVGASLGWHDYLGSTARLFKEEGSYRIPVKADPDIVIKYIKASHDLLANVVGARGGIKIGGMYGILPIDNDLHSDSFQITINGFFRDVITQMKRDLSGFWVAHPDFVRIGMAIVEAWNKYAKGEERLLKEIIEGLLNEKYAKEIWDFVKADDIDGLEVTDEMYPRSLIVADIKESTFIANNHPDEIRYNVFQSLQYLTDWLTGNGCVALPAQINDVPVRVMDDLATAERSRWEVWHELYHGRFSMEDFIKIAHEEMNFIRRDLSNDKKIVQVKYTPENAKWYDVAFKLMLKLMTDKEPVEFATELLIPFTVDSIRAAGDPWDAITKIDSAKYSIEQSVQTYNYYFEMCGCQRFAKTMVKNTALDVDQVKSVIQTFNQDEINEAAAFHGNIGESAINLDAKAKKEQAKAAQSAQAARDACLSYGEKYLEKFGFKFLISAKGKSAEFMLSELKRRLENSKEAELQNARDALCEITLKRMNAEPIDGLKKKLTELFNASSVKGLQLAISKKEGIQTLCFGTANQTDVVTAETQFEIASLSKTYGSAFAIELFKEHDIPLEKPVNELLKELGADFKLESTIDPSWGDKVQLKHLMSHAALNMHYVNGFDFGAEVPKAEVLLKGLPANDYPKADVIHEPGTKFKYSGAGFILLEYIVELFLAKDNKTLPAFFNYPKDLHQIASGFRDNGDALESGVKLFPKFAAGMFETSAGVLEFLRKIGNAYHNKKGDQDISHDTAVQMLFGKDKGCQEFMAANMGLGVFIVEAGENRFMLHQGANDGFRAIYLYCYQGPDKYKGFCLLANGELEAVKLIARFSQEIIKAINVTGVHFEKFITDFKTEGLSQEEIVNIGYKELFLKAFQRDLPEEVEHQRSALPLSEYNVLIEAEILKVSNDRFARAENIICPLEPKFDPKLFGKQGKIMDSWESARHNENEADELHLSLKSSSDINYARFSTKYHYGNQVPFVSLQLKSSGQNEFQTVITKLPLEGHALTKVRLPKTFKNCTEVKILIHPDGGLTRVELFNELPDKDKSEFLNLKEAKSIVFDEAIPETTKPMTMSFEHLKYDVSKAKQKEINYASAAFGAKVLSATDEHYAPALSVLSPFPPLNMFDGLESKRSRAIGHKEQIIIQLAQEIIPGRIEIFFDYFVNNNPKYMEIKSLRGDTWHEVIEMTEVKAYAGNCLVFHPRKQNSTYQLLFNLYPDGGINRIKVYK